jgi:hypothetical protein
MSDVDGQCSERGVGDRKDEGGVHGACVCDASGARSVVSRDVIEGRSNLTASGALSSGKGRRGRGLEEKFKVECRAILVLMCKSRCVGFLNVSRSEGWDSSSKGDSMHDAFSCMSHARRLSTRLRRARCVELAPSR